MYHTQSRNEETTHDLFLRILPLKIAIIWKNGNAVANLSWWNDI